MKKLVLVALTALLATAASGCIITTGDDAPEADAFVTAKWSIKNIASNDNTLPCPPGTTTTALYNQAIDESGTLLGQPEIDLFNCSDFQGTSGGLIPDVYQSWVELTSDGGANVYARSLSSIVDVIDVDKTFETTILEDGGYFQVDWTLRDANGAGTLSCAQAAATHVSLDVTIAGPTVPPVAVDLPCEQGFGVSQGFIMGTYQVAITATDADGPLGETILKSNVVINDRNEVTDLGHVDIPIN